METNRIRIKVSNRISRVTKVNRDKVEIRIKMVEHRVRTAKVIRDSRIREVNRGVNKVLDKIRTEDKLADRMDRNLRIIRTVIRLDKEMPITLRMDKDNSSLRVVSKILEINRTELVKMVNSSNSKAANKDICLICLELETKWGSRVSQVKVRILEVMVDNKVNKTVVVHQVKDRIKLEIRPEVISQVEMEVHRVSKTVDLRVLVVIILTVIMTERKLLKMRLTMLKTKDKADNKVSKDRVMVSRVKDRVVSKVLVKVKKAMVMDKVRRVKAKVTVVVCRRKCKTTTTVISRLSMI